MFPSDGFLYGFRVLGNCRQRRRLVDVGAALRAYAACDARTELERESYLSAFRFGPDFRDYLAASGSTAGFAGPCWAEFVWLDIDRADLGEALFAARRLATATVESLGIDENDVLAFFSGGKGAHLGIPTAPFVPSPGLGFHHTARRFAEALAQRAGVEVDSSVYDRVRCFRAPNSRHPRTGLHKRRLSVDELMHLGTDAIRKFAAQPAEFELPEPTYRSEPAVALWTEATAQVQREANARADRLASGDAPNNLNRLTLEFIRGGAAVGDRHRLLYSAARNLGEFGCSAALAHALLTDAALDCGLSPSDARRQIECGIGEAPKGKDA